MNNLYHKVAVASICTALSFTLGADQEAKAATITLTPAASFYSFDLNAMGTAEGDGYLVQKTLLVGTEWTNGKLEFKNEFRALYEFNIASLSFASNTIIRSAIFQARIVNVSLVPYFSRLQAYGYRGDGEMSRTDHAAGEYLLEEKVFNWFIKESKPMEILNFNVLPFINQKITNSDTFVGFNIRAQTYPREVGYISLEQNASLIIETAEPVPEPTTIFGSALALGVGGWLKRKKSSQHNKTTSQN
jgi:hypothetical protein